MRYACVSEDLLYISVMIIGPAVDIYIYNLSDFGEAMKHTNAGTRSGTCSKYHSSCLKMSG